MSKSLPMDTNKDAIQAYLVDPDDDDTKLTRKQRDLLDWYVDAYTIIRNYNSFPDAIQILKKLGDRRGQSISVSTARRYIKDALELFGPANRLKPEIIKDIVVDTLMDARNMAKAMGNTAVMVQAAKELQNVGGIEDVGALNADQIERHVVEIHIDQTTQRALKKVISGGTVDLDDLLHRDAEVVDFEEVKDARGESI